MILSHVSSGIKEGRKNSSEVSMVVVMLSWAAIVHLMMILFSRKQGEVLALLK